MKVMSPKRIWVWFGVLTAVIILVAAVVVLFISARLQQSLLTKQPSYDATTLYSRGVDQAGKGDYASAEQSLEQALTQQDDATYRGELAVVKYHLKKYEESIALYQKLITDGKDASFAWNGIGNAYRDWADSDTSQSDTLRKKAIDAYGQSITLNAQYVVSYSNLALLYEAQNNKPAALGILAKGIAATGSSDLVSIRDRMTQK